MPDARCFLDTNIFVYAFDTRYAGKQKVAADLVVRLLREQRGVTSLQVIQEFLNVAIRASVPGLGKREGKTYYKRIFSNFEMVAPSLAFYEYGLHLQERYGCSWYDALIIAAALQAKCEVLYSEDMQHGQKIESLTIVNPFLPE